MSHFVNVTTMLPLLTVRRSQLHFDRVGTEILCQRSVLDRNEITHQYLIKRSTLERIRGYHC